MRCSRKLITDVPAVSGVRNFIVMLHDLPGARLMVVGIPPMPTAVEIILDDARQMHHIIRLTNVAVWVDGVVTQQLHMAKYYWK